MSLQLRFSMGKIVGIDFQFQGRDKWRAGARQQVIADQGEGLEDAIVFMRKNLDHFGYKDLTFSVDEIQVEGNSYFFKLRERKTTQIVRAIMQESGDDSDTKN